MAVANWSDSEVINLIELWGEEGIQEQLEGAKRNKHVFEKLGRELKKTGSDKTAEQCRAKIKKLKLDYRKIKDKHNKTGEGRSTWKYFDTMDAVLGHRPTTRPSAVLDTSEQPDEDDEGGSEDGEEDKGSEEQSNLSTAIALEDAQSSHALSPSSSSSTKDAQSSGSKGKKRKRTKDEKIEAIMTSVVKEVVNSQRESDKMFFEMEEKRMKYEAEQRKEERDFQLRMMSMLFGSQNTHMTPEQYSPYHPFSSFPNSYKDM